MAFCLPPQYANKFLVALRDGTINPEQLVKMTSPERHAFFGSLLGPENAHEVNALFESKMLLKDYKRGLISWAKSVAGLKEPVRRDLISRIERMDKILNPADEQSFLADLASKKLGASVTYEEAQGIMARAQTVQKLRNNWDKDKSIMDQKANPRDPNAGWNSETDRLEYGLAEVEYHQYLNELLGKNQSMWQQFKSKPFRTTSAALKGFLAAFDDSFFGRQGIKMLYTNPNTWSSAFLKSWKDMYQTLKGMDVMTAIKADIFSRANAMNGKYRAARIAVGVEFEEAFPSTLPEKIPLLGKIYKATEVAFNGAALRLRADYADKIIALAEQAGVNTLDPAQAKGIGYLVNAMTGRGNIPGMSKGVADTVNATFFSARFLKSNFDTLTMHRLGRGLPEGPVRSFATRQAAQNLLKIIGGTAAILYTANQLWPGSVELDPRSTDFGKIRIGNTRIDVTGGMGSLVTLAARIITRQTKSSVTHEIKSLNSGKFGQPTVLDVLNQFWEGKLSPLAGMFRDIFRGKVAGGQPATPSALAQNLLIPLPGQTVQDLLTQPDAAPFLGAIIADELGFSTNTYASLYPVDPKLSRAENIKHMSTAIREKKIELHNSLKDRSLNAEQRQDIAKQYNQLIKDRQTQLKQYTQEH